MTNEEGALKIDSLRQEVLGLLKDAETIPWSAGSRRGAYIAGLHAAEQSLLAAFFAWASEKDLPK